MGVVMGRGYWRVLSLLLVGTAGGCASGAHVVREDPHGGELQVWGPVVPATAAARRVLLERCGGRFAVGDGANDLGLGAADPSIATMDSVVADGSDGVRHVAYRCVRPSSVRHRSSMAFLRGGFER